MRRIAIVVAAITALVLLTGTGRGEQPVLARVERVRPLEAIPLPVRGMLRDGAGVDYALVVATQAELAKSGWPYRVLDREAGTEHIVIAAPVRAGAPPARTTMPAVPPGFWPWPPC